MSGARPKHLRVRPRAVGRPSPFSCRRSQDGAGSCGIRSGDGPGGHDHWVIAAGKDRVQHSDMVRRRRRRRLQRDAALATPAVSTSYGPVNRRVLEAASNCGSAADAILAMRSNAAICEQQIDCSIGPGVSGICATHLRTMLKLAQTCSSSETTTAANHASP
jgi:hypothetical protein